MISMAACGPSLVITDVDYSQPIESVLSPDENNVVQDQRYGISFSVAPVLEEENVASADEIRLIRSSRGYYFLTAAGFANVYVFGPADGELELETIIEITEEGLEQPALNQREDHIEVIDRATGDTYRVNQDGRI
ncbi:MAG: hypothetical protein WEC12_01890 [Balneolaceae bacterium]